MDFHLGRKEALYEGYYIAFSGLGMQLSEEPDAMPIPMANSYRPITSVAVNEVLPTAKSNDHRIHLS